MADQGFQPQLNNRIESDIEHRTLARQDNVARLVSVSEAVVNVSRATTLERPLVLLAAEVSWYD